jgi:succinate dehydrogenase / fumarate reductase flavoprotein subunit
MYYKIVDEDPYKTPMMIYPAVHYTMVELGLIIIYKQQFQVVSIGESNSQITEQTD